MIDSRVAAMGGYKSCEWCNHFGWSVAERNTDERPEAILDKQPWTDNIAGVMVHVSVLYEDDYELSMSRCGVLWCIIHLSSWPGGARPLPGTLCSLPSTRFVTSDL